MKKKPNNSDRIFFVCLLFFDHLHFFFHLNAKRTFLIKESAFLMEKGSKQMTFLSIFDLFTFILTLFFHHLTLLKIICSLFFDQKFRSFFQDHEGALSVELVSRNTYPWCT